MTQVTLRLDDALWNEIKAAARARGRSANQYVTEILAAIADPVNASSESERLRERLARAGLLDESPRTAIAPGPDAVAAARRRAGAGTPLAELVAEGRR